MRLDPNDFREAPDVNISGHGDLARQGKDKFDSRSRLEIDVNQKVQAAETDVARLSLLFVPAPVSGSDP